MKVQIKNVIFVLLLVIIFYHHPVFASVVPPSSPCQITGTIKSVVFKDAYDKPCLKTNSCPTDIEVSFPARFYLDINIDSVSGISGESDSNTCNKMYPVGSVKKIFINKSKVKNGDIFSVRQKIEGVVHSFLGDLFDSYNLQKETTKSSNKISEELNGKLFFLIPVHFSIQKTVDINGGIKVIKPWWAFLVKY